MFKNLFTKNKKENRLIFMDYASGAPIGLSVLKKMIPFFSKSFFNPSSIYQEGVDTRKTLDDSRKNIANILHARQEEIIFADGGTEANNLVLRGLVSNWRNGNNKQTPHIITSKIEHASILETCNYLKNKKLAEVDYVSVNENGIVDLKELKNLICENTVLVSISYVNGEIGVIQDIKTIAKSIRHYRKNNDTKIPYFHTDAVQAVNYCNINVQQLGVDFMTINGSKIYGPKKIAVLYKKAGLKLDPIITGGLQEFGLRAGTENIPYIIGLSEALFITDKMKNLEIERLKKLQEYAEKLLKEEINIDFIINGQNIERIPNIINISIPELSSEEMVLRLDSIGVKASTKSACKSGGHGESHVIKALREDNTQSIRFSFGRDTSKRDINYLVKNLVNIINKMYETGKKYQK